MKVKAVLCLMLASVVSAESFALEIYKGHVVSHKEWSTGNAKGAFAVSKVMSSAFKLNRSAVKNSEGRQNIFTEIAPIAGTIGSPLAVTSDNGIFMSNDGETAKSFRYTYSICANVTDKTSQCLYYQDEIQLEAGGYFNNYLSPQLQVTYAAAGTYETFAETTVATSDWTSTTNSTSMGYVTIS